MLQQTEVLMLAMFGFSYKNISMISLDVLDIINVVSSLVSLILAALAIFLALYFYNKAREAEKNTEVAINKIGEATSTLSTISMKMLTRLTNYVTSPNPTEQSLISIISELKAVEPLADSEMSSRPTTAELDQFRVDNLIAALFYAAIANTSLQLLLPEDIGQIDSVDAIVRTVDQSKQDYFTLKTWIANSNDVRLNSSPVKHMYDQAIGLDNNIRNVAEFYSNKQNQTI